MIRIARVAALLILPAAMFGSAWAVEDELLNREVAQTMILTKLNSELQRLGFSDVQIKFTQFPEKFSYPNGSQLTLDEMAGHRRLGIRRFKISAVGERGVRKTAFCAAAVSAEGPEIRARYHIPAGKRVAESDLLITRSRIDDLPTTAATDPAQILDQESNRNIAQNDRVELHFLRMPFAVQKGEIIEVELALGGIQAKVFGEAQSAGFVGDRIPFKNTLSLKRFFAKIIGPRQAQVVWAEGENG